VARTNRRSLERTIHEVLPHRFLLRLTLRPIPTRTHSMPLSKTHWSAEGGGASARSGTVPADGS